MVLIIAYGNSLRRDDGAGFVLGRILEGLLVKSGAMVQRIDCHQLTPELALDIAADGVSAVIFLDTRILVSSDDFNLHIQDVFVPESAGSAAGHHMDSSVLLAYAGVLSRKAVPPAWLVTVPGIDFDHGEGFSKATEGVLRSASEDLRDFAGMVLKKTAKLCDS